MKWGKFLISGPLGVRHIEVVAPELGLHSKCKSLADRYVKRSLSYLVFSS